MASVIVYCPCGELHKLDDRRIIGQKPNRSIVFCCPVTGEVTKLNEEPLGVVLRFESDDAEPATAAADS
jgi:hypothetical protein